MITKQKQQILQELKVIRKYLNYIKSKMVKKDMLLSNEEKQSKNLKK